MYMQTSMSTQDIRHTYRTNPKTSPRRVRKRAPGSLCLAAFGDVKLSRKPSLALAHSQLRADSFSLRYAIFTEIHVRVHVHVRVGAHETSRSDQNQIIYMYVCCLLSNLRNKRRVYVRTCTYTCKPSPRSSAVQYSQLQKVEPYSVLFILFSLSLLLLSSTSLFLYQQGEKNHRKSRCASIPRPILLRISLPNIFSPKGFPNGLARKEKKNKKLEFNSEQNLKESILGTAEWLQLQVPVQVRDCQSLFALPFKSPMLAVSCESTEMLFFPYSFRTETSFTHNSIQSHGYDVYSHA